MVDILAASLMHLKTIDVSRDPRNQLQIVAHLIRSKGFTGENLLVNMPVAMKQHNKNGEPWEVIAKLLPLPPCRCGLMKLGWQHHNEHQQEMHISQRGSWKLKPLEVSGVKVSACAWLANKLAEKEERDEKRAEKNDKKRETGNGSATMKQWAGLKNTHDARVEARKQREAEEWDK